MQSISDSVNPSPARQLSQPVETKYQTLHPTIDEQKQTALTFVRARPALFRKDFLEWLDSNFSVWLAFKKEADRIWWMGRRHYSARTILHWLRHETILREANNELGLKINNNVSPDLSRLYVCYYPDRADFFEKRSSGPRIRCASAHDRSCP